MIGKGVGDPMPIGTTGDRYMIAKRSSGGDPSKNVSLHLGVLYFICTSCQGQGIGHVHIF